MPMERNCTVCHCALMAKTVAERAWRDAKLLEIGGGTNESHHKYMCRNLRRMGGTSKLRSP